MGKNKTKSYSILIRQAALFFTAFLVITTNLYSVELKGRLSSELYFNEINDTSHVSIYERLRADLNLYRNTDSRTIGFHTYLRWKSDLTNKLSNDPQTYIYDGYLKLSNYPQGTEIRIGRQFVYSPIGSALLDGLKIKYRIRKSATIELYGGSAVTSVDPEKVQSISDFGVYGGRLSFRFGSTRLGISSLLRQSEGDISSFRFGIDGRYSKNKLNLYSRIALNAYNMRLADLLLRGSYRFAEYYLSAEFRWREPSVNSSSLFALIEFKRYRELRFEAHRNIWKQIRLISSLNLNLYENDNSVGLKFGLASGNWSLAWQRKSGYGGENNGLVGFGLVKLHYNWELYVSASLNRYKIQEMQVELSDAYTTTLGIQTKFGKDITTRLEVQYLRNAVQSDDTRAFFRITKGFAFK